MGMGSSRALFPPPKVLVFSFTFFQPQHSCSCSPPSLIGVETSWFQTFWFVKKNSQKSTAIDFDTSFFVIRNQWFSVLFLCSLGQRFLAGPWKLF